MKRFLLISFLLAAVNMGSKACLDMTTYNYYLFHTWMAPTGHYLYENGKPEYGGRSHIDQFWRDYTGNPDCTYFDNKEDILDKARQQGDRELLTYIDWLDKYIGAGQTLNRDEWDYPTKEELAECRKDLEDMRTAARQYSGTRLKAQYQLLEMRANMLLENHQGNVTLWEKKGEKMPASVYRDLMENIYAGALFHTGKREKACDIFARQGDAESIQWALLKYQNLAGIRTIYADNPNSNSLYYLIDEYVNNVQEFVDQDGFHDWDEERMESVRNVKKEAQFRKEALGFADFAAQVVREGRTNDPCLWQTARAMIHYELGMQAEAQQDIEAAARLNGSESSRLVRRYINMLIMAANPQADEHTLVSELKWLSNEYRKAEEFPRSMAYRAYQRILIHGIARRYHQAGNHPMEAAVWGCYTSDEEARFRAVETDVTDAEEDWNPNFSTAYFAELHTLSGNELAAYVQLLNAPQGGELDRYILSKVERNDDFYNDLVGTRLLHDGQFKEAIPYLERVPLTYLEGLNVSYYLAHRDYHIERWYQRQRSKKDKEGARLGQLSTNPKLDFCREVLQKKHQLTLGGSKEERCATAYALATMLTQASDDGECWFLSDYGWTASYDYDEEGEPQPKRSTLLMQAKELLEVSRTSGDGHLKLRSLYALAWLPVDSWADIDRTWENGESIAHYKPRRNSYRYAALQALDQYVELNPQLKDRYVTKCDVLKQFRKTK